jgi:hypothetical protein
MNPGQQVWVTLPQGAAQVLTPTWSVWQVSPFTQSVEQRVPLQVSQRLHLTGNSPFASQLICSPLPLQRCVQVGTHDPDLQACPAGQGEHEEPQELTLVSLLHAFPHA